MTAEDDWTWTFTQRAVDQFDGLDTHVQDRIVTKLDEVVASEWRTPDEFLDPLTGGPFSKLRVGQYRLACVLDREARVLEVHRIEHRSGAYTADDWLHHPHIARRFTRYPLEAGCHGRGDLLRGDAVR